MSTKGVGPPSSQGLPTPWGRTAFAVVLRSLLFSVALLVGYFVLPLSSRLVTATVLELALGLVVLSGLLAWQVREIVRSSVPGARAIGAIMVSAPLFLTVFATTYFTMAHSDPDTFSEPLTRLDALYFTLTVFATVGFGDITAVSQPARAVVIMQMAGGLVLVGLIARVIFGAVQVSRDRNRAAPSE